MTFAYFISESEFKQRASWSRNIDVHWNLSFFRDAQVIYIRALLCKPLYDALYAQVAATMPTPDSMPNYALLPPVWEALRQQLLPCLVYYIQSDAIIQANVRVNNVGVTENSGQNQSSAQDGKTVQLQGQYRTRAQDYERLVKEFLNENASDYPLWKKHANTGEEVFLGIHYPKRGGCNSTNCEH